jgi:hypothetical protein
MDENAEAKLINSAGYWQRRAGWGAGTGLLLLNGSPTLAHAAAVIHFVMGGCWLRC